MKAFRVLFAPLLLTVAVSATVVSHCDVLIAGTVKYVYSVRECCLVNCYCCCYEIGGSLSAFAAAITSVNVSRHNTLKVHTCLLEPTDWPGTFGPVYTLFSLSLVI
jgi:hypothetical protein